MPAPLRVRVRRRLRRSAEQARQRVETARARRQRGFTAGVVEKLTGKEILGWVEVAKDAPTVRVELCINEFAATSVAAVPTDTLHSNAEIRTFRFAVNDFWKYVRQHDQINLRVDGSQLPFTGRGMYYLPRNNGIGQVADLKKKLANGYVFASNGRLLLSKNRDAAWQALVMGLYNRVRAAVHEIVGYDAFLIYGSLLGAVRDNGFIGHDFDFDAAYISDRRDGPAAGLELGELARKLVDYGFTVESRVICLHIFDPHSEGVRIDLFHLFFDEGGTLRFPWGVAGTSDYRLAQWTGTKEIPFGGSTGLIPSNAEAMVEAMYGASWRTPNSGFSWARDRTAKASEGRIPAKLGALVNWESFYASTLFDAPSPFFESVVELADLPRNVVDIGSGEGRDSVAFARAGRTVLGIDQSEIGLRRAEERAAELPADERPSFVHADIDDREQFRSVLASVTRPEGSERVLYYGRFLLHALPEDTRTTLFEVIAEVAQADDYLALEFRTTDDSKGPKVHALPERHYVDAAAVVAALTEYGFVIESTEAGTGLSPYGKEDPELFRLVARRSQ